MNNESKCNCQRCGQPIAFPADMINQEIECPHCQKATTLIAQNRVRALPAEQPYQSVSAPWERPGLPPLASANVAAKSNEGLILAGYLCGFLLPIVGFIIGIILLARNSVGSGIGCIIVSAICGFIWIAILSSM
jgi:hypothetical protein